ncbi:MAG: Rossmann-like and DUF2520 domain-containing protein, partial [Bacteroidota bacterium]
MLSVIILGTGNVAENLFFAFQGTTHIAVEQVFGRNPSSVQKFAKKVDVVSDYADIAQADIYIIAVSDKALGNVAEKLSDKKGLIVHTSGAEAMDAIKSKNRGVFYPLQTFTKGRVLEFRDIPICIEARTNTGLEQLKQLAQSISRNIHIVDSGKRKKIHLAAVFCNNFSNHLFHIGKTICESENLPFDLLKPLLLETVEKLGTLSPFEAQTGPARRKDITSIKKHEELLAKNAYQKIYAIMSESIQKTYEKKL